MRRLGRLWIIVAAVFTVGLTLGWYVDREPVPARPIDQTTPVDPGWYDRLPFDASVASEAYLSRIPANMRERGEAYSDTRMRAFWYRVLTLLLATALISATGLAAWMRGLAQRWFSKPSAIDAAVAVQYFMALYALSLPAEVYATFVRPHRFGLSDQSFAAWLADSLANWAVITLFYFLGVLAIYWFIRKRPMQWVGWAIGTYAVLRATYAFLSPNLIEPLTSDFEALPEGRQRQLIVALAGQNGLVGTDIVTGNASQRSRLLNAHVSGLLGTARISLDDTTLSQTSDPMLTFVVAHEIGHFVLAHEIARIIADSLVMAAGLVLVAVSTGLLVRRFGERWGMRSLGDIATLPVLWGLFLLWGYVSLPATNAVARIYEHQADLFGLNASQAPHGMAEFMIHDADIARLRPTSLEYALFYAHPSDAERVATAMQWRAEKAKALR